MVGRNHSIEGTRRWIGLLCFVILLSAIGSSPGWVSTALLNLSAVKCGSQWVIHNELDLALMGQSPSPDASSACAGVLPDLQTAQRLNSNSVRSKFWIGYAHLARGDLASAAVAFDQSAALEPGNSVAWLFSGLAFDRLGQGEAAVSRWQRIPDSARAITALADRLAGRDDCAGAQRYYRLAVQQPPPGLEQAHLGLADCLYKQERFEEAASEYQTALQLGLKNDVVANRLGKLLVQLGRPREAIPWLALALEWHLYPWHMIDLAKAFEAAGDLASAEYWLAEVERQFPRSPGGFWEFGNYYYRHEQYREAVNHYQHSVILSPQGPYYFYSSLGQAYLAMECPGKAVEAFTQALQRDPENSVIMEWLKNAQSAEKDCSRRMSIKPHSVHRKLAYCE